MPAPRKDYNYQFGDIDKLRDEAQYVKELEEEVFRLHNPHSGEECNCDICKEVR